MKISQTPFEGLLEIEPSIYHDDRGWFYEFFKTETFRSAGIDLDFVQENQSFSIQGVIRGLHLQMDPHAQAKLVTVLWGKCLDVVVDLRVNSATFGRVYYCPLDSDSRKMLLVPTGFGHGFAALTDCLFHYKCSRLYNKQAEAGIRWDDRSLAINWGIPNPIVSEKDQGLPTFEEFMRKSVFSQ